MIRSKTIFSALLCSVSVISLAQAAPAPVTDWHVAPVLSPGHQNLPYCALATSYPQAGVIVTHARNKHGTGTIALDFQEGAFERGQFYGVDISFDDMTRSFAAQARNNRLLVIDMAEDHPLYSALNAGQDLTVTVQNGGPSAVLAGNSRPFFQLNYCVQALNDDAAADIIVHNPRVLPSFGLQAPAPRRSETIVLRPPQPKQPVLSHKTEPAVVVTPVAAPVVAQSGATRDGDESRQLRSMLDQARQQTTEKPVRQKLSGISSADDIDPNTIAPLNRNTRQSLLFDDPQAADHYVAPRLEHIETQTQTQAPKPAPSAAKASDKVKAVMEKQKQAQQQAQQEARKKIAAPQTHKTTPASTTDITTHTSPALPMPLPLPDDDKPVVAQKHITDKTARAVVTPVEVKDRTRTVLATDYLAEKQTGIPAKPFDITSKAITPKSANKHVEKHVAAPDKKAVPVAIQWDEPVVTSPVAHGVTQNAQHKSEPAPAGTKAVAPNAITTTSVATPSVIERPASIFSGQPAAIRNAAPIAKTSVSAAPVLAVSPVTEPKEVAPTASIPKSGAAKPTTQIEHKPVVASHATMEKSKEKSGQADHVTSQVASPVIRPVPPAAPAQSMSKAMTEQAPVVMAAPALPPAIIAEEQIAPPSKAPVKRSAARPVSRSSEPARSAAHAVAVTFPEDEIEDISADISPAPAWSAKVAQKKPLAVPSALLQSKPTGATKFVPPASSAASAWSVSVAGDQDGPYCVIKNRFSNQQNLFISRAVDGSTTLGVDYGMDLLQLNRDYKATVHVDHLFVEDFVGQARQENLLVLQMGRKDSFYDALRQGKALHVALTGGASTFDISDFNKVVPDFDKCMVQHGGQALSARITAPVPAAAPVVASAAPTTPAQTAIASSAKALATALVTEKATSTALPAPRSGAAIREAAGLGAMTTPQTSVTALAAPQVAAPKVATPPARGAHDKAKSTDNTPAPRTSSVSLTPVKVNAILQRASIRATAHAERGGFSWGRSDDLVRGHVAEKKFARGKEDVLEGALRDIDAREKECGASFGSEIGIPEQYGQIEIMSVETRCTRAGETEIQATLYQRLGRLFRIWTLRSTQSDRDMVISQRDRLHGALQTD